PTGDEHDGHPCVQRADTLGHFPAVHARHSDVRHDDVVAARRVDLEGGRAAGSGAHLVAGGHEVSAAAGGAAALKIYTPGRYDVVMTNVGMAGMNGWEVTERVRALDARVPVVFITGW